MTTLNAEISANGYVEHQNNGHDENGSSIDITDGQNLKLSQTSYSQDHGMGIGTSSTGSKPEDDRKLFVGGLTWDTTQEDLREYFRKFGNIIDCSIKHDPSTGCSRGFGFLVFDSKDIVEKILSHNDHIIKGRKVDPKPAHRRLNATNTQLHNNPSNKISSHSSLYGVIPSSAMSYANMGIGGVNMNPYSNNRKVFVGGLDPTFPDLQLREYFSKFGKIDEIDLPYDKEKNERRPFCFISFQTEQAAQEVLRLQRHTIGDISVDVKPAKPKTLNNQQQQQRKVQQSFYNPYEQPSKYTNQASTMSSYGSGAYSTNDPYTHWNAYTYNQQANPAAYSYGNSNASTSGISTYSQYPDYPSNTVNSNDYYSQYGYGGAPPPESIYSDPKGYSTGSYDYASYYSQTHTGMNGTMIDNGVGEQSGNSADNQIDYEHDNHYGKAKTSIVSSPTYHPYSRN